jgi:thiamine pyrophosphate-dependent acetolactate synthase large subunit-like protein
VEDRIIAPVPDKSQGLKEAAFTYTKADALVRDSDIVVVIGYSFNPHDRASYQPLLQALSASPGRRLLVVSPDAGSIAKRYPSGLPETFH